MRQLVDPWRRHILPGLASGCILLAGLATSGPCDEAAVARPETTKPETAKPEAAKPETAKPETPKPETPKPEKPKPETPPPSSAAAPAAAAAARGNAGAAGPPAAVIPTVPLARVLAFAEAEFSYLHRHVHDYRCVLIKRERIGRRLQATRYIETSVRHPVVRNGQVVRPYAVYMEYLAPKKVAGRKMLYVDGKNDNMILVRKGGTRFDFVTLKVEVDSDAARRESRVSILHAGFDGLAKEMIRTLRRIQRVDPKSRNTRAYMFRNAKIDGRSCTHIRVVHPRRQAGLDCHRIDVYVDDAHHLPIHTEAYDWPASQEQQPPLLGQFTFRNFRFNVGLTDGDFSPRLLEENGPRGAAGHATGGTRR